MLGWSQEELAEAAQVSRMTVVDFERAARLPHSNSVAAVRAALQAAGVEFINGDAPGVCLVLQLSVPTVDNGRYVFQCVHRGNRFSVQASCALLDALDEASAPGRPTSMRPARLALLVLPKLNRLLAARGEIATGEIVGLSARDL
jgi:transcriptional regulator with XRE-family HTH domain